MRRLDTLVSGAVRFVCEGPCQKRGLHFFHVAAEVVSDEGRCYTVLSLSKVVTKRRI